MSCAIEIAVLVRWCQGRNYRDAADACALGPMASEGPGGQWRKKRKKDEQNKNFYFEMPIGLKGSSMGSMGSLDASCCVITQLLDGGGPVSTLSVFCLLPSRGRLPA